MGLGDPGTVIAVDAGCRWGLPPGWEELGNALVYFGFDPDHDECTRLNALLGHSSTVREFVPIALAATAGRRKVHVTREPACSSFYPPVPGIADEFPTLDAVSLAHTVIVTCTRLDMWAGQRGLPRIDVVKLDTQGSELEILEGAGTLLESISVIDTEVEFNPIYEGQPLFGDVDRFLREAGFVLWRLSNLVHYRRRGVGPDHTGPDHHAFDHDNVEFTRRGGQLYWGHALFVRDDVVRGRADQATQKRVIRFALTTGLTDLAATIRRNSPQ